MGKFVLELALFTGILCQIYLLTSRTNNNEGAPPVTLMSIEATYKSDSYTMNPYEVTPHISNQTILQELARKEAERIIQTGDYESFQKKLENNQAIRNLMGQSL